MKNELNDFVHSSGDEDGSAMVMRMKKRKKMDSVSSDPAATVKLQSPLLSAVAVPMDVEPSNSSTVLLAAAEPVNVGVLLVLNPLVLIVPSAWSRVGLGDC